MDAEFEASRATADQLEIDSGEQLAVEQRAVLGPRREIDLEAPAQRIQARLRPGKTPAGERERILDGAAQGLLAEPAQLGIDEFEVELGIVNDQPSVADEIQELVGDRGKGGMLGEKFRR